MVPDRVRTDSRGSIDSSTSLASLSPGEAGRIVSLRSSSGVESQARRLADIGFVPGSIVTVERRAPLGDPTVYVLRGTRVALRRVAAEMIVVQAIDVTSDVSGEEAIVEVVE